MGSQMMRYWLPLAAAVDPALRWARPIASTGNPAFELDLLRAWARQIDERARDDPTPTHVALAQTWAKGVAACGALANRASNADNAKRACSEGVDASVPRAVRDALADLWRSIEEQDPWCAFGDPVDVVDWDALIQPITTAVTSGDAALVSSVLAQVDRRIAFRTAAASIREAHLPDPATNGADAHRRSARLWRRVRDAIDAAR